MAVFALGCRTSLEMKSMFRRIIFGWHVTKCTCLVAYAFELYGMRIVACTASYPFVKHFALQKRSVDIIFIIHLSIGMIKFGIRDLRNIVVHNLFAVDMGTTQ